jgi:membrane fusion protein (multidrug efflux system)
VLESPKGKFVYVVNAESKAEPRPIEVGDWSGDGWIVNTGLKPGEHVIVDGVMKLGPGAPVKIAEGTAPAVDPGAPGGAQAKRAGKGPEQPAAAPADKK